MEQLDSDSVSPVLKYIVWVGTARNGPPFGRDPAIQPLDIKD